MKRRKLVSVGKKSKASSDPGEKRVGKMGGSTHREVLPWEERTDDHLVNYTSEKGENPPDARKETDPLAGFKIDSVRHLPS